MADDNDEVIVSLPGDTSTVQVTKAADVEIKKASDADDPVADLKGQFAALQSRVSVAESTAQQATQQATEATQRAQQMEGQVVSSQLDTVLSGIAAADAEASAAEQVLAQAIEAGDAAMQARANRAIAVATTRLQRLQEAKEDLEDAVKDRSVQRQQQQRRPSADPVETFTKGMSQRSAAWIKAHPDCVTDPKKNARMLAAHNLAVADDVQVDSDEYFRRIEDGIGAKVVKKDEPKVGDGRRPSSAAASGSGASGNLNGGGVEVRLTKREAESATDGTLVWNYADPSGQNRWQKGDPIGLAEMARRKHEGVKNGLYDKSYSEN